MPVPPSDYCGVHICEIEAKYCQYSYYTKYPGNKCTHFTCFTCDARVATAQGKQGIWLLTFPDRENTGNLVNLIFYTGKIVLTRKKI